MTSVFESIAEILEAVELPVHAEVTSGTAGQAATDSTTLILYAPARGAAREGVPLMEIHLTKLQAGYRVSAMSGVGVIEWNHFDEIRLLESTGEVAFVREDSNNRISLLTISSRGVIQIYAYLDRSLLEADLAEVDENDLRSAVALKMFLEQGRLLVA